MPAPLAALCCQEMDAAGLRGLPGLATPSAAARLHLAPPARRPKEQLSFVIVPNCLVLIWLKAGQSGSAVDKKPMARRMKRERRKGGNLQKHECLSNPDDWTR